MKLLISVGILLLVLSGAYLLIPTDRYTFNEQTIWGVTYSAEHARSLGLDDRDIYARMFDELNLKTVRLPVYWDLVEPTDGQFNFDELDWQMKIAHEKGIDVVLALGYKTPRWPECRKPDWVANDPQVIQDALKEYINVVVTHYKDHGALFAWQIENEPYFTFGECTSRIQNFLEEEIHYTRLADEEHPIIVTDSGELSFWRRASQVGANIFGFTTYRVVWSPWLGYTKWWPLTPLSYRKKTQFLDDSIQDVYAMEVQVEPWHQKFIADVSLEEQKEIFSLELVEENLQFAKNMGMTRTYLWGVEWWYFLQEQQGYDDVLDTVQKYLAE